MIKDILIPLSYLFSAVLFILGLKGLTRVRTARRGNLMAAMAMLIAIITTLVELGSIDYKWILIGLVVGGAVGALAALKVEMTAMPEMVALLNGLLRRRRLGAGRQLGALSQHHRTAARRCAGGPARRRRGDRRDRRVVDLHRCPDALR